MLLVPKKVITAFVIILTMKLTERIQRWTNAQQLEFDLHGFAAVNKFEQEHLSHIHGDYLLTLACNPYEPLKEVVRLQITCTANDFADRTWIAHRERLEAANSVITLAAGQSMPLLERLWRVTTNQLGLCESIQTSPWRRWRLFDCCTLELFRNAHRH